MGNISSKLTSITFGSSGGPTLARCTVNTTTGATSGVGTDSGSALNLSGDFVATKVWNAVWNDVADFQLLNDKLIYGKCYFDTKDGAMLCTKRCQMSAIGMASDTFGISAGGGANPGSEVPIAIGGWVLAFVDKEYPCGTPLTNDSNGNLTEMTKDEKMHYPERLLAIYKKAEEANLWGPEGRQIKVNGRHWVKVK